MQQISKRFGDVLALDRVDYSVSQGEIHALVGENGAGKSTLMNLLFGLLPPDSGKILLDEKEIHLRNPLSAMRRGIAMVHQHFMLSPTLTVAENLALSFKEDHALFFKPKNWNAHTQELANKYDLAIPAKAKIEELSVGEQQRVEILKAVAQDCRILVLDEPTALLTPYEVDSLFKIFRKLKEQNKTIIFITHKLNEVFHLCDRATVLRRGRIEGTFDVAKTSEKKLAACMMGSLKETELKKEKPNKPIDLWLELKDVSVKNDRKVNVLKEVTLSLYEGEVVGVVGVEGNGQQELVEVVRGMRPNVTGHRFSCADRIGYIPSDRVKEGLVLPFSIEENFLLEPRFLNECSPHRWIDRKKTRRFAQNLIHKYGIITKSESDLVETLSGGNQQKVVVARELALKPKGVVAVNPTWGLDINATQYVRQQLMELCSQGVGILLVTIDIEEAISLSDRLFVLFKGRLQEIAKKDWNLKKIGRAMLGL